MPSGLDNINLYKSKDLNTQSQSTSTANQSTGERTLVSSSRDSSHPERLDAVQSQHDVGALAREISTESRGFGHDVFKYKLGSVFDPFAASFNASSWFHQFAQLEFLGGPRRSGISFKDTSVYGFGSDADFQKTVGTVPLRLLSMAKGLFSNSKRKVQILNSIDGVVDAGEMLVVLGPPGSGCTTMLKTIAGEMNGIYLEDKAELNYKGISPKDMHSRFRGEALYTAETDIHFPRLTVGQTLTFAAEARAPPFPGEGISQAQYARYLKDVVMAIFGISHTNDTIVGNNYVRGVSGGERKRVSIAEAALSGAPLQCWDNSTRGLDSATAIEFVKTLRLCSEYFDTTCVVAIYQAPQAAYDLFDKVCVLYEGEQIFFGKTSEAKRFFVDMGFACPPQQTTPDFLTSLTSPSERVAGPGFEGKVPTSPAEFVAAWKASAEYEHLQQEIGSFRKTNPLGGETFSEFSAIRKADKSRYMRDKSPYTLSYWSQVKLCVKRGFWRLKADPTLTLTQLFGNMMMSLVIGSLFYNLPSFRARGATLFLAVLLNAFGAALEILTLYAQRPIVEKHTQYAFYCPSAEAIASMLTDMPYKMLNAITFNLPLYFMTNLRREAGPFFFYLLINFVSTLAMSMFFRTLGAVSRNLVQALIPSTILIVGMVMYTGFAIPVAYMRGWASWMRYLNPVQFGFEALMVNEFDDRVFECTNIVPSGPGYGGLAPTQQRCTTVGAELGSFEVNGTAYINQSYEYYAKNKWRDFGLILVFVIGLMVVYLVASDLISAEKSKGEILIYQRGRVPASLQAKNDDVEDAPVKATKASAPSREKSDVQIRRQTAIVTWKDVVYDIKIKKESRRILNHVDGWVKPGTLTALMGVSGAGKTTLLDVLATRVTTGVITGKVLVDGKPRDVSFQRKTGYVQQQDIHLTTSTVREALEFSAVLRQPKDVPYKDKIAYVDEVLKLLEMDGYAGAVVGAHGEGLNVEQRKRLSIGVELVAKPALLLFLDEPTSGLDSQTSWNILQLLKKLADHGQAILCTIHQPSAILFEQFDRLLFLAKGGRTVYYGQVGKESKTLIDYLVRNGGHDCPGGENPAEWMFNVIGSTPGSRSEIDWPQKWIDSPERMAVRDELDQIEAERSRLSEKESSGTQPGEFSASFLTQFKMVTTRSWQHLWRTPTYGYSKIGVTVICGFYIGFSFFDADRSIQGVTNQLFAIFMLFLLFGQLVEQMQPNFVLQRDLYEVRERPSKVYSWQVFVVSNILAELPWAILGGTLLFFTWYYPPGFYNNAALTDTTNLRGAIMWLFVVVYMLFTSTFGFLMVAAIETAETAANIGNLLFFLCFMFCGVLQPPDSLVRFWIFMYRVSPFTYFVEGMLGTAIGRSPIECSPLEFATFQPRSGETCGAYMEAYQSRAGGYLIDPNATSDCQFCPVSTTDDLMASFNIFYANNWRDFGILLGYLVFNVVGAVLLYWAVRVPKNKKKTG